MFDNSFIYKRHSVRKFKDTKVPMEHIEEIIKAGSFAPSGKNMQNWHFVVINNKELIEKIAKTVEEKNKAIADKILDENVKEKFTKGIRYQLAFKNAPTVILVYTGKYIPTGYNELKLAGAPQEELEALLATASGVQGVSAAIENIMLTSANMGYGTCWITGPVYAAKEISETIGFKKEGYSLMALTPLGVPLDAEVKSPPRKPVEEIMTVIE
ncbi:nitroreductase family protein [Clostridium ganghwense]|uniref:Nitroreductase family protein n=1 Tax=Clostridium ganghwense TaxID=312089 RepID=A0ABT4CS70_9CLOT|nr:nitroreductase family protein [Clostridium ganghwense]MCY6371914.1 nitroreductase family protein [Clostridium ganghwense]